MKAKTDAIAAVLAKDTDLKSKLEADNTAQNKEYEDKLALDTATYALSAATTAKTAADAAKTAADAAVTAATTV